MAENHFVEILTIALGEEIFGLPASVVLEILDIGPTTPAHRQTDQLPRQSGAACRSSPALER
jgi:hypothetical protein